MNLLSLYHFFAGKASDKQKEAIKRWAESSPDNYETLDFLFEEERIKKEEKEISKIMIEQVEEEQKIQPSKKRRL